MAVTKPTPVDDDVDKLLADLTAQARALAGAVDALEQSERESRVALNLLQADGAAEGPPAVRDHLKLFRDVQKRLERAQAALAEARQLKERLENLPRSGTTDVALDPGLRDRVKMSLLRRSRMMR